MVSTIDSIAAGYASVRFTAVIEGFPYILTSGDPAAALVAYGDSSITAYTNDFTTAIGGLSVFWDSSQRVTPYKPFTEPDIIRMSVVPASTSGSSVVSDIVGTTVFKRTGGNTTRITADVDCDATTITTARSDDFAASGYLYMGPETVGYSSRDTGTDVFTVSTRGFASVFATDTDARFARTHKPLDPNQLSQGIPPLVTSEPRTWVGRWVAIWIHADRGGVWDVPEFDGSGAHLAFAGQLVGVEDADGATVFTCEDVRRKIYETRLFRDQYRARLAEGIWIPTGTTFSVLTELHTNTADTVDPGNDLVCVASGATGANQFNEGRYTAAELGQYLNTWLQAERAATRILFNVRYIALYEDSGTIRGRMTMTDPAASGGMHIVALSCSSAAPFIFLGWSGGGVFQASGNTSDAVNSDTAPKRFQLDIQGEGITFTVSEPTGTWVDQRTLLPSDLQHPVQLYTGILKVGDLGYVRAKQTNATTFVCTGQGVDSYFGASGVRLGLQAAVDGEDVSLEVTQVLILDSTFEELFLSVIFSTGTSGFNSATYDELPEQLGCGVPYSICGNDFVSEVSNLDCADSPLTTLITGPTRFQELFDSDFILRRCFFAWGGGRLRLNSWATPTSTYASYTLSETTKATPTGTIDINRSSVGEDDDFVNLVRIQYNQNAGTGEYLDELTLKDAISIREHGERGIVIKARNAVRFAGAFGSPLDELISNFASLFGFTSRPWKIVKRSMDITRFNVTTPGTVLSVTDGYVRDPATGLRYSNQTATGGLSGHPGMVVGQSFDWGGVEAGKNGGRPTTRPAAGEVEIMLSPVTTQATYVPCAQVDDTQANAGYNAGTKVLTFYAHEHTESSGSNDNTFFSAGDKVLIVEIDPSVAASPTSWSDEIASLGTNTATLTTGLAGWDNTKKYRMIYDAYGTVTSTQKAKCYQADDTDLMIVDTVQPYSFAAIMGSQNQTYTGSPATEVPARHATVAYGDGKPVDTGYERDACRTANNLIHYKTAFQSPTAYSEIRNYTGSGTWRMVECQQVFIGRGGFVAGVTRLLSTAPRMRSTTGGTASVRITLGRRRPTGSSCDDVVRTDAYVSATYTATSTTFAVSTAQTLDVSHCKLTDTLLGGIGWLYVELSSIAEYGGLARAVLGPVQ